VGGQLCATVVGCCFDLREIILCVSLFYLLLFDALRSLFLVMGVRGSFYPEPVFWHDFCPCSCLVPPSLCARELPCVLPPLFLFSPSFWSLKVLYRPPPPLPSEASPSPLLRLVFFCTNRTPPVISDPPPGTTNSHSGVGFSPVPRSDFQPAANLPGNFFFTAPYPLVRLKEGGIEGDFGRARLFPSQVPPCIFCEGTCRLLRVIGLATDDFRSSVSENPT